MPVTVTIRDETTSGNVYHEIPLQLPSERVTIRELLRERIYQEVQDFNRRGDAPVFRGLVQPTDAERLLNKGRHSYRLAQRRNLDWKAQFENALESFQRCGFFILIDERQAESLDQECRISPQTQITFVKLTPLVGG